MATVASWQTPRMKARGAAFAVIAFLQFVVLQNLQAHASEALFKEFPFMVRCTVDSTHHAFYLSQIGSDGVAVYISPGRLAGTITIEGKAKPVGGSGAGSCAGKTLEQLRSAGQVYDLR